MTLHTATRPKLSRKRPRSPFQRDIDQRLARIEASLDRHSTAVAGLRLKLEDLLERITGSTDGRPVHFADNVSPGRRCGAVMWQHATSIPADVTCGDCRWMLANNMHLDPLARGRFRPAEPDAPVDRAGERR